MNGIGGNTIEVAKSSMSYREFKVWGSYRNKRGTLNHGLRFDSGIALLASMYANTHSKNGGYKPSDFTPYHDEPEIDLNTAMTEWV